MVIFSFAFIFKLTFFLKIAMFWLIFYAVLIFWRSELVLYYYFFKFTTLSCTYTHCRTLNFNTSLFFGDDPPIIVFYMTCTSHLYVSACLSIHLSKYPSVWHSVYLYIRLSVHLCVCLSLSLSLNCINALKRIVFF